MTQVRYFHGGPRGLRVGSYILPPTETGKRSLSDYGAAGVHRRDRVYVATDISGAAIYAVMHPSMNGVVYEVAPEGDIEPDPDCDQFGLSFSCVRARIIAVRKMRGNFMRKARKALLADAHIR